MRRGRTAVLLSLALLGHVGCSSVLRPEVLQAWIGRPAATLEHDWGPATRRIQDGELQILIYEEVEKYQRRDFETTAAPRSRTPYEAAQIAAREAYLAPTLYVRSYLFWVNREGTIVHAKMHQP
ncbi:MAG: hypothetical protein ACRELA_24230 [Candidatus Rokuibacteriota bacterium]